MFNLRLKNSYFDLIEIFSSLPSNRISSLYTLTFLTIISSFLEFLSLGSIIPFIAIITDFNRLDEIIIIKNFFNFLSIDEHFSQARLITVTFVSVILFTFFFRMYLTFFTLRLSESITGELEKKIYVNSIKMNYQDHKSFSSSKIISTITQKIFEFSQLLFALLQAFSAIFICIVLVFSILLFSFQITIIVLSFFLIAFFIIINFSNSLLKKHSKIVSDSQKSLVLQLQDTFASLKNIKINNNSDYFIKEYSKHLYKKVNSVSINNFISRYPRFLIETLAIVFMALTSFYLFIINESSIVILLDDFVIIAIAATRILPLINQIYFAWSTLIGYSSGLKDINHLVKLEIKDQKYNVDKIRFKNEINLKNIYFKQPNTNNYLFSNFNLKIKKNTNTAIIGKSGSGKSTLLEIMMCLVKPEKGQIFIDEIEINEQNFVEYHKIISFVSQNTYLLQDTLKKNIAFGIEDSKINLCKLEKSAINSDILDFVRSKLNKFDFVISENSKNISGGQKQRIALARAFYDNFDILFLDEPTSGLDNETEDKIIEDILKFKNLGKTSIIVLHNKKYLDKFDNIINLDNQTF